MRREYFRIEADAEFSPFWSHEINNYNSVCSLYMALLENPNYTNVKAIRVTEECGKESIFELLYIR